MSLKKTLIIAVGIALICFGVWGYSQKYRATHNPSPEITSQVVAYSTDTPDETPPGKSCDDYSVPDHAPRKIEIPGTGISGCVQRVGVDQKGLIAVPTNIHVAGWFVNSPAPGEKGVSIIDGHVMGRYSNAIFTGLEQIRPGDKVRVQFGDKTWREFETVSIDSYSIEETASEQFRLMDNIENQLTLITCGGNFDAGSQSYDQRVVVRSKLISDL